MPISLLGKFYINENKNLFKFMRQIPNNFTIIKSIEINFLYMFLVKEKYLFFFFFSYTYYFSFTNRNPLQLALFPLFSSKRTTLSLSLMLFPYYQMAKWPQLIPSTFLPVLRVRDTQSLCPINGKKTLCLALMRQFSLSLSLSHAVLLLPNCRMTTINTFNLLTSSACVTLSKSLPKKMARRLFFFFLISGKKTVSCLNEVSN